MLTLDLFESDDNKPQAAYVPVGPHYPGSKNRALGNANLALLMKSLDTPGNPPITLNFLDGTNRQLTPEEINLIADHYDTLTSKADRANFIYRTLLSRTKMFELLYRLKQGKLNLEPARDKDEPPAPEQLNLFQEQKKSSEPKFKSTRLDRLKTQARARHPSAASDTEAMVADFVDQQDQDQQEFTKVKTVNRRQDDLLKQITALNKSQEKEIDNLEAEENNLQQNIQQLRAANAELAKKLSGMSARRQPDTTTAQPAVTSAPVTITQPTSTAVTPGPGVSVATDKPKQARNMRYVPIGQTLARTPGQLARGPVGTASIDGKEVDVLPAKSRLKSVDIPGGLRTSLRRQAMEVQDIPFGMAEDQMQSIPAKSVIQGYTVEYNSAKREVIVSRRGQVVGRAINKPGSYNNYQVIVGRIIDASEEDKYPDDLEARGVERPFGESQEEMTAQDVLFRTAAKAMYDANREGIDIDYEEAIRIASRLMNIPYAPSMLPALQQQLADVEKKIATLKSVRKNQRQREKEKLTHQSTADEQRRAEEWMKNYGQSLQRRLQTPRTESTQQNKKSNEAYEQGGREAYYGRANKNPYQPGTKEHADYNRGYRDFQDDGKDYLREVDQPNDDVLRNLFKDFEQIFGKQPQQPNSQEPEKKEIKEVGRAGYNPLTSEKHWHEVERYLSKMINEPSLDPETRKEFRQRYLEKRREAQSKGWIK